MLAFDESRSETVEIVGFGIFAIFSYNGKETASWLRPQSAAKAQRRGQRSWGMCIFFAEGNVCVEMELSKTKSINKGLKKTAQRRETECD